MAAISQKSVSKLIMLLGWLFGNSRPERTLPRWSWQGFRSALYERGLDVHVLDYIWQEYNGRPSSFLPLIHDGTIPAYLRSEGYGQPVPNPDDRATGQGWLWAMIEVTIARAEHLSQLESAEELIASLKEDGLAFLGGKIVPAAMKAADLKREDEYLIALIRSINPPNMAEIQHGHDESEKAFASGIWGSVSSEARNFLIAVLRGLRAVATTRGTVPPFNQPGKDGPLIDDYQTIGLFTNEEKGAVKHVWVLLSHSGPHPGIKEQDSARLSRLLAIGMAEWIVLKFIEWEKGGFKPFPAAVFPAR